MKLNLRLPPIAYILMILVLVGGGYKLWEFFNQPGQSNPTIPLQQRASSGERILILVNSSHDKNEGTKSFAKGDYQQATQYFQASLSANRNDPEARIYLSNSIARTGGKKSLKIAIVIPISSNLNVAQEMLRGIAQVQTEINKQGGIQGRPVEVIIFNDENNSKLASEIAEELTKVPDVLAVVGHNASNASLAAAPVYERAGVVMISPTSSSDDLSAVGKNIFRTLPNTQTLTRTLAERMKQDGRRKVAICIDAQATDNNSFKDRFIVELSNREVKVVNSHCDVSSKDFNADQLIEMISSNGADALFISSHIDRSELALQLARANKGKLPLYAGPNLNTFNTLQAGDSVAGLILVTPWIHQSEAPKGSFSDRANQLWGAPVNWRSALSFDAGMAIITGLQQSNGTRSSLQQTLRSPQFSAAGATGEVKFQSNGDRVMIPTLAQINQVNSRWVFTLAPQPKATSINQTTTPQQ